MGVFAYQGRREGEAVTGRLQAESGEAVARHLATLGVVPVEITPVRESDDVLALLRERLRRRRVKLDDLIVFAKQMRTTSRAGLSILRAMGGIAETTRNEHLSDSLRDVVESIEAGRDLAGALGRHPDVFSPLFIATVQMGEETGRLEEAFEQLANYLEVERDTRKRIKSATRYPMIVIGGIGIAMVILNLFALPTFADIFSEFGAELPLATRMLIASSNFTVAWWPWMLVASVAAVLGARYWLRSESGRLRFDRHKLRFPVVGSIIERATLARFARTLALALRSGVPVIRSLRIAAQVADNAWLEGQLLDLGESIERGDTLTRSAVSSGLFPPLVIQMMSLGEETGALDELLYEVAIYYEGEVDYELKRLSESIEPILIAGMGVLVLVLALGVYLPMWDLAGAARGG